MKIILAHLLSFALFASLALASAEKAEDYALPLPDVICSALQQVSESKKCDIKSIFQNAGVAFGSDTWIALDSEKKALYMRLTRPNALIVLYVVGQAFELSEQEAFTYLSFDRDFDVVESIEYKAEQDAAANP